MHANVVVKRIPYVTVPSPFKRTNLFRSVTSCKKLTKIKVFNKKMLNLSLCRTLFFVTYAYRSQRTCPEPKFLIFEIERRSEKKNMKKEKE